MPAFVIQEGSYVFVMTTSSKVKLSNELKGETGWICIVITKWTIHNVLTAYYDKKIKQIDYIMHSLTQVMFVIDVVR